MQFASTRGLSEPLAFSAAVEQGLAPDGGLYIPQEMPDITPYLEEWKSLDYPSLCVEFFSLFVDFDKETLAEIVHRSYQQFDHPQIAPLVSLEEDLQVLELFHGPTLAFKDFALQLLGNLYEYQISQTGRPINVLGATSGDTGAAAISGLLGKKGVNIFILYPRGGVSALQERQMTCTQANNVYPIAIDGPFDDGQKMVKEAFADVAFKKEVGLSAVNSINLARILAQCVYYLYAWFRLSEKQQARANFVVPTGNFGNILAGWMVRKMGVKIPRFTVATNRNDILYRLFQTGVYDVGTVEPSIAPSMDIQVASNFERFLYYLVGEDSANVREIMKSFAETKRYEFPNFDFTHFASVRCSDEEIEENILSAYQKYGYILDPHTACAFQDLPTDLCNVVLSTAHPAKFPDTILKVIGKDATSPRLEALKTIEPVSYRLRAHDVEAVKHFVRENVNN